MNIRKGYVLALPLAVALAVPAVAQNDNRASQENKPAQATTTQGQAQDQTQLQPAQNERQPLQLEQKEGFWGKLNPFARKKYVRRQLTPVVGRVNELDELTAANSKAIRDVDSRASEGIRLASLRVNEANTRAVEAGNRANLAHETAAKATNHLQEIEKTVNTIDQYQTISDMEIRFRPGQNVLSRRAQQALDELAQPLREQKGYVVEVQGFSSGSGRSALENSQRMAEAVVRYLVIEHEVPVYRVFTVGMGNVPVKAEDGSKPRRIKGGRVNVALLKNSIGNLQTAQAPPVGGGDEMALPQSDQPAQQPQQEQHKKQNPDEPK